MRGVDIWKTFVIGFWAFFNSVFFLKFLAREKGMRIRFKSGTTQKLYDSSWSLLIILHLLVWGVEAVMWPFTYFNWFTFGNLKHASNPTFILLFALWVMAQYLTGRTCVLSTCDACRQHPMYMLAEWHRFCGYRMIQFLHLSFTLRETENLKRIN